MIKASAQSNEPKQMSVPVTPIGRIEKFQLLENSTLQNSTTLLNDKSQTEHSILDSHAVIEQTISGGATEEVTDDTPSRAKTNARQAVDSKK